MAIIKIKDLRMRAPPVAVMTIPSWNIVQRCEFVSNERTARAAAVERAAGRSSMIRPRVVFLRCFDRACVVSQVSHQRLAADLKSDARDKIREANRRRKRRVRVLLQVVRALRAARLARSISQEVARDQVSNDVSHKDLVP